MRERCSIQLTEYLNNKEVYDETVPTLILNLFFSSCLDPGISDCLREYPLAIDSCSNFCASPNFRSNYDIRSTTVYECCSNYDYARPNFSTSIFNQRPKANRTFICHYVS